MKLYQKGKIILDENGNVTGVKACENLLDEKEPDFNNTVIEILNQTANFGDDNKDVRPNAEDSQMEEEK